METEQNLNGLKIQGEIKALSNLALADKEMISYTPETVGT